MVIDALHVGLDVVGQFDLLADADVLGAPVEIAHVHGGTRFAGDQVEAGLPALDGLAGAFRGDGQMELVDRIHFADEAPDHRGGAFPVHGNGAAGAQEGAHWPEEEFLLDHDAGLLAELGIEQVADEEVPDGGVRDAQDDGFLLHHRAAVARPAETTEQPAAEFRPTGADGTLVLCHN